MARQSASPAVTGAVLPALFVSLRPEQWTKNLFVFAALLFGHHLGNPHSVLLATATFAVFCALSGAVYLVNDVADRSSDRQHPIKRHRPIASGRLSPRVALVAAVVLSAAAAAGAFAVGTGVGVTALGYLGLLVLYSAVLKHLVILDALAIATGFVLRAAAGALAISAPISHWLLICTALLALFLALSKRRHELTLLADGAIGHRPILEEYSPYLLDQMVAAVTASALVSYASYTASPDTAARLGTDRLPLTVPFVLYGIFRYLYLVHQKHRGGNPSTLLVTDRPLLACVALWAASIIVLLYTPAGSTWP